MTAEKSPTTLFILTIAALIIIIAGMKAAQAIIIPFLLSGFIAIICGPPLVWLQKKGLPTVLAILVVIAAVSLLGLLVTTLIGSSVNDFSRELPVYQAKLDNKTAQLASLLGTLGVNIEDKALAEYIDPGAAMHFSAKLLSGFGNVLSNAFIIMITVIFILLEASSFRAKIHNAFANRRPGSLAAFDHFIDSVNQYMAIKTWVSLATGIFVTGWLVVLKVDYPLLWGLLAFLLNYVPNIGSIIAAIPATLLALIQLGPTTALLAAGGYALVNIVIGNVIEPRFMGKGLGLSTLVVFISLAFWGWVLGPVGMLLSVPLTMTVKIALSRSEETSWLSTMMG
ncbi:MAG: AI-2E family transporter [Desulfobulbaceae bacterium]|nr:AI-2E family transporter [Desulfobulbaceae bacterium]